MANYLSKNEDLVNNPATRVPVCLCLDLSGSMGEIEEGDFKSTGRTETVDGKVYNIVEGGISRLDQLRAGLNLFFDAIRDDDTAVDAAEIAIVGFSNKAIKLLDFNHIDNQAVPKMYADGSTAMGEGVNMALQMLEERKQLYKENGIQYYQPWLVIMTDGENNGDKFEFKKAEDKINTLVKEGKLCVFALAIGKEADIDTLSRLTPKRRPLRLKGLRFKEFVTWLSKAVSRTSTSKIGDVVNLPPCDDWATL